MKDDKQNDAYDIVTGVIYCTNGGIVRLSPLEHRIFDILRRSSLPVNRQILAERTNKPVGSVSVMLTRLAYKLVGTSAPLQRVGGAMIKLNGSVAVMRHDELKRCPYCGGKVSNTNDG